MAHRVLVVDDLSIGQMLSERLGARGFQVTAVSSGEAALERLEAEDFEVVLTELKLPREGGIALCERLAGSRPSLPVLVITAFGSLETAVQAIRAGAYDFITKPFEMDVLVMALERAVQHRLLLAELKRLRQEAREGPRFEEIVGESTVMRELSLMVSRVAASSASVLLTGESGTGKELVARALHAGGRRCDKPFVPINCAAMPEALLESELFGHEKGAFTDAKQARLGLFFQADGGTLFLDEIGDLPLGLQPKLLRALEERKARPLGGSAEREFDVRLVAATNRDLEVAVEEGRFREDLFYRINVVVLEVPPLRDRGTDILLLAERFAESFARREDKELDGIAAAAAEKLLTYCWPGNVRELRNTMERAVALAQFSQVTVDDLPAKVREYRPSHVLVAGTSPSELVSMAEVERRYVVRVLEAVGGSRTRAAQILGFDRKTLYRKLKTYGLKDGDEPSA